MTFSSASDLWNKWNIRVFMILSLSLQVFLILFASLRKKTTDRYILSLLWLTYLMADWVATFTIGLISHGQGNSCAHEAEVSKTLQAFWASFLLLHLGGPDTVTAFSLEDSSLWGRHLLTLIFQIGAAIYVFVQIFPNDRSLMIPTILVFLAGVIKNAERTFALNLSSLPKLKQSMLTRIPTIKKSVLSRYGSSLGLADELVKELNTLPDGYHDGQEAKIAESIVVKHAYYFFNISNVFLGDLIFRKRDRKMSCEYFSKISAMDALRVISVELHFIYEVLHTKALVIRSKWSYIFRFIAVTNVVVAYILFNHRKKHRLLILDVEITYLLLFGGIALDVIALFMLVVSDWTVAGIKWFDPESSKLNSFLHKLASIIGDLRKPQFTTCKTRPDANVTYKILDTPLIFRRWSESIYACNLLSENFKESPRKMCMCERGKAIIVFSNICNFPFRMSKKIISYFYQAGEIIVTVCCRRNMMGAIVNMKHVSKNPFINELWIFIFNELRSKCGNVNDSTHLRNIFDARGDMFLKNMTDCSNLSIDVTEASYESNIITWHLATEIWYNRDKQLAKDEKEFSKILSDYMLYLLLNQPDVVSAVTSVAPMTSTGTLYNLMKYARGAKDVEDLCKKLYEDPIIAYDSRSQLKKGIDLAKKMENLQDKWKVMSGVWLEMLSYAAIHITREAHMRVLSKGGELLAFVWLLMAHFGIA